MSTRILCCTLALGLFGCGLEGSPDDPWPDATTTSHPQAVVTPCTVARIVDFEACIRRERGRLPELLEALVIPNSARALCTYSPRSLQTGSRVLHNPRCVVRFNGAWYLSFLLGRGSMSSLEVGNLGLIARGPLTAEQREAVQVDDADLLLLDGTIPLWDIAVDTDASGERTWTAVAGGRLVQAATATSPELRTCDGCHGLRAEGPERLREARSDLEPGDYIFHPIGFGPTNVGPNDEGVLRTAEMDELRRHYGCSCAGRDTEPCRILQLLGPYLPPEGVEPDLHMEVVSPAPPVNLPPG